MNKQTITILAIVAVVVVIAIAALTFRNQTIAEPTVSPENNIVTEGDVMEGDVMEENDTMPMQQDPIENGAYTVQPSDSTVEWEGRKTLIANYADSGTINVESGSFNVANGTVSGGTITLDMASIETTYVTMTALGTAGLTKHLKSPDFFDVEEYPTATFAVIGSEAGEAEGTLNVRGNLTIKGHTEAVTIPVKIGMENGRAVVMGSIEVDRTLFDVRFGSGKFSDDLADNVIDDMFSLTFTLTADKK